jgi:hypothetical protein
MKNPKKTSSGGSRGRDRSNLGGPNIDKESLPEARQRQGYDGEILEQIL